MFSMLTGVSDLSNRGPGIRQEARFICGVHPRARDHTGAVARTNFVFEGIDDCVERGGIDKSLFDEQRFQRLDAQGRVRRNHLMVVRMRVIVHSKSLPRCRTIHNRHRVGDTLLVTGPEFLDHVESGIRSQADSTGRKAQSNGFAGCGLPEAGYQAAADCPRNSSRRDGVISGSGFLGDNGAEQSMSHAWAKAGLV